jgi:hypothetical protein
MCTENMTRVTMKRILVDRVWLAGAFGETWSSQGMERDKQLKACQTGRSTHHIQVSIGGDIALRKVGISFLVAY